MTASSKQPSARQVDKSPEEEAVIVCGTDFSANAMNAATAAAVIAKGLGHTLILVHAFEEAIDATPRDFEPLIAVARNRLHKEAERLRNLGALVREECALGFPDALLVEFAERHHAEFIIVSSLGRRAPGRWLVGSVAERVAEAAALPTLVIRAAQPFEAWARGTPLNILVGADFSTSSDSALRVIPLLQKVGPCEVTVAHIAPPGGHLLPGSGDEAMSVDLKPEYQKMLENTLRAKVESAIGQTDVRIQITPNWGRVDNALLLLAGELKADLIIVGTHRRHGAALLWHGSVSRGILHGATVSVGCAAG